jgi:phosphohistidine phosphatase SixA
VKQPSSRHAASRSSCARFALPALFALLAAAATLADLPPQDGSLSGHDLLAALQGGGYVILMRHASSPGKPPDAAQADADNLRQERQLDEQGITTARRMGEALRRLHIPVGVVLSSPTYRALETVKLAELGRPVTAPELGEGGAGMLQDKSGARASWLEARVAQTPPAGKNTVIVTHYPNIVEVYPDGANALAEGEALILHPDGRGRAAVVARVKIDEWASLGTR